MKYEFHPEAEQELYEAALRYESRLPGLGQRFGDEIRRVIELLLANPELGARADNNLRHFVLRRFPFSIVRPPGIGFFGSPNQLNLRANRRFLDNRSLNSLSSIIK